MNDRIRQRLEAYLALRSERPADFANEPNGVKVETDVERILAIEEKIARGYERRGYPRSWAEVGLAYQDPYFRLVRDAVTFLDGREAIHHRVLSSNDPSGAAVLPIRGGNIVLLRHFRHATRKFHWEIPRGGVDPGQDDETVAKAELLEEIGANVIELVRLGRVHGSTALISGSVSLFLAKIDKLGEPELAEGIVAIREVSPGEFERMVAASEIDDSFTLTAFLHARLRKLI